VLNRKGEVTTTSVPKRFVCARCVQAGVARPPTLAVVGEAHRDPKSGLPDFDADILGGAPAVLIRFARRNKSEAKMDNSNLIPLALPLDPNGPYAMPSAIDPGFDSGCFETARFLAIRRLLPRAEVEVEPLKWEDAPIARTTIVRAPFEPLLDSYKQTLIECPVRDRRGKRHRVQVTRGQLVRRAVQAIAEGDNFPTI
jgi:hypothetical protein